MDARTLETIAYDKSSGVTYELRVSVQNGRLTPAERKRIAETLERQGRALQVQITMMSDGKALAELKRFSSATGSDVIDIGQED